jgi:monofunctional glycosyltransferase
MLARTPDIAKLRTVWLRTVVKPARIAGQLARAFLGVFVLGHAALLLFVLFASLFLLHWNPPFTALMVYRAVTAHQKAQPVRFLPLRQIPRVARSMVVRLEDYRFYQHGGVDLGAIREAWTINRSLGRTVVGGSTIPMQLARNLFLTPRKTYFRKYMEAIIAVEMDVLLPKDRILELYLNCIEWGKGVYGIGAASASYYKTGVSVLGLDQLRRLVTIITNPVRYNVQTFPKSAQMAERYAYLVSRFPDPSAEPSGAGLVAPIPDVARLEEPPRLGRGPVPATVAATTPTPATTAPAANAAPDVPRN